MNSLQLLGEAQFHGAKRLAVSKYKLCWALSLAVLLCCSISVLTVTINRYFDNPTYVTIVDTKRDWKPFPTVVVCPEVEFPQYKIDAFLKDLNYPSGMNESVIAQILPQLGAFFSPDVAYVVDDLYKIEYLLDFNNLDIETAGRQLTLDCEETIIRCRWLNKYMNCTTAFTLELTSYGFCCIFNGLSLRREIKNFGIHSLRPKRKLFVNSLGFTNALVVALNQSQMTFHSLDLSYKWVTLQNAQYADIIYNGTPISPGVETWVAYMSNILQVSDDTRDLADELRHCKLTDELLTFFPNYHKKYCLLECEMDRVWRRCNCAHIRHPFRGELPVCGTRHIACVKQAAVSFAGHNVCRCPPSCDTEIESTIVSTNELFLNSQEYDDFYTDLDFNNISIVRMYVLRYNRHIIYRRSYFINFHLFSQLGGVFNVFFGCSILSLLEISQLFRRIVCDLYNQVRGKKKNVKIKKSKEPQAKLFLK